MSTRGKSKIIYNLLPKIFKVIVSTIVARFLFQEGFCLVSCLGHMDRIMYFIAIYLLVR